MNKQEILHHQDSKYSITKTLNDLCLSHLTDSDQAKLEGFIEDFFDESQEEEDLDPPSKIKMNT